MSILNVPIQSGGVTMEQVNAAVQEAVAGVCSVQEYDTDEGWHVRKYSDGFIEMTYKGPCITITPDQWKVFNANSPNYYYPLNLISGQPLPAALTAKDFEAGSYWRTQNSYLTLIAYTTPSTSTEYTSGYAALCFGKPSNDEICALAIYVRGRWK